MPDAAQAFQDGGRGIGFQHQPFDDKVIGRIKEARIAYPGLPISVDGGVSLITAPALIAAGAERLGTSNAVALVLEEAGGKAAALTGNY